MIAVETYSIALLCMLFQFHPGLTATDRPFSPTSIPDALYGDHVCTRTVLRPSYVTSDFTYSCWKTREVQCSDCHGSRCQKVPMYTTPSQGAWRPTTTRAWSEPSVTSHLMTTLKPDVGGATITIKPDVGGATITIKPDVGGATSPEASSDSDAPDWWPSPTAVPHATEPTYHPDPGTSVPSWVSSGWSWNTQPWSSNPWNPHTSSVPSWVSSGWSWNTQPWSSNTWNPHTSSWVSSGWFSNSWWTPTSSPNAPVRCYMRQLEECHDTKHTVSYVWTDEQYCCKGYQQFGQICIESDHCMVNNGGCEQICEDGLHGPKCSCWSGFESDGGSGCLDIDECYRDGGICDHKCFNVAGAHYCQCNPGYEHTSIGRCEAINLCQYGNGGCEHYCVNTSSGEHHCKCSPGFSLVDGIRCEDSRLVSDDDDDDGGLSTLELTGIVIGCILIGLIIGYFIFLAVRWFRKSQTPLLASSVSSTPPGTPEVTKAYLKGLEAGMKNEYEDVAAGKANDGNFYVNEKVQQKQPVSI